jgi:Ser/Thr protein kinase RdoA (MazF antagonist)
MRVLPHPLFLYQKIRAHLASYPEIPDQFTVILQNYDLELKDFRLKSAGGNRSTSIIIQTSKGKKLFKKYKSTLGHSTITQEHSILKYLEKVGFPAPRLFPTKAGGTLVKSGQHYYALFDFIEDGFQYYNFLFFPKQSTEHISTAGQTLGCLHKTLTNFNPLGFNPDGFRSKVKDRWRDLKWYNQKLDNCKKKSTENKSKHLKNKLSILVSKADDLIKELKRLDNLLLKLNLFRLVIHGDYGPYNLLFRKKAQTVVLDFEMARLDWRLVDIIQAWMRFCHGRSGFDLTKMKIFFDAYQDQMPVDSSELKLIPDVWRHVNIRGLIRNLHNYCNFGKEASLESTIKSLRTIDWIGENENILLKHICF